MSDILTIGTISKQVSTWRGMETMTRPRVRAFRVGRTYRVTVAETFRSTVIVGDGLSKADAIALANRVA